jgi:diguanylate cyclase (GGDEF)-like protein
MKNPQISVFSGKIVGVSFLLTAMFSFAVILATFFVSNSALSFETKTAVFLAIAIIYLLLCAVFYFWQRSSLSNLIATQSFSPINEDIEGKLFALEEANEFFGASLKTSDMFRLVASRINEIVPFAACVLFLRDADETILQIKYAVGENSRDFMNFKADTNKGLAAKTFLSGKIQTDSTLLFEKRVFPPEILGSFKTAVAVPLTVRDETFGVLVLYGGAENNFDENSLTLLNAVGERVAPLFVSSFAFEKSISNALTDSLTNLPNERAFFLVLENQMAEAHRYRDERPLTVLALDVRNFAEINQKFGHAAGDRLLEFAAGIIKNQLRQMDVLSRSSGDEFLAVLPTAKGQISEDIIQRIKRAFVLNPFELSAQEKVHLEINFGAATFWRDGETANELLKTARLRKEQDKAVEKGKVIRFPKEFVN